MHTSVGQRCCLPLHTHYNHALLLALFCAVYPALSPSTRTRKLQIRYTTLPSCTLQTPGPQSPLTVRHPASSQHPVSHYIMFHPPFSPLPSLHVAVDLINRLLQVSRKSRFRTTQALNHKWLGVRSCVGWKGLEKEIVKG